MALTESALKKRKKGLSILASLLPDFLGGSVVKIKKKRKRQLEKQ